MAYLFDEGVGIVEGFFIKGTIVFKENGEFYITAKGDTPAKFTGTIDYNMYAEIRVNDKTVQKVNFRESGSGYWPHDDDYSPIGTVEMKLLTPQPNTKISLFLSASYAYSTSHGSVVPITSINIFSLQATRATKEIQLNVINNTHFI